MSEGRDVRDESVAELVSSLGPTVGRNALQAGLLSGLAGATCGGIAGTVRSTTPVLFAIASGLQCFGIGACYWTSRQSLMIAYARKNGTKVADVTRAQRREASTISGAATGLIMGAVIRGRANMIPGALVFSGVAFTGQYIYDLLDQSQLESTSTKAETMLQRFSKSRFSPLRNLSDDEYKHMLEEKRIRIDAELAQIDDHIHRLRQQQNPDKP